MTNMYENVKTWNPFVGCGFKCSYCIPAFQVQAKRWGKNNCQKCYTYEPHFHEERLKRVPTGDTIFVAALGDLSFATDVELMKIWHVIRRYPEKTFLIQPKNPERFKNIIFPDNVVFGTTIETNRTTTVDISISSAPETQERYWWLARHRHRRKFVTIEPIMDFDQNFMVHWIREIAPEVVWIGYDNHKTGLPEPTLEKTEALIEELRKRKGTEIRLKTIRRAWDEEIPA